MELKTIWQKFTKKLKSEFIPDSILSPEIRVAPTLSASFETKKPAAKKRVRIAKAKAKAKTRSKITKVTPTKKRNKI